MFLKLTEKKIDVIRYLCNCHIKLHIYVPDVTEGDEFHDVTALFINVIAIINNAVYMLILRTSNTFMITNQ